MIKSAGLTSASDRPIHPTDTPPPPHTGRLNNLCTISNMKEDLLTTPKPASTLCNLSGLLRWRYRLKAGLFEAGCGCKAPNAVLLESGMFRLLLNFKGRKMGRELCNWKKRSKIVKEHSVGHAEGLVICLRIFSWRHTLPSNYGCRQK